MTSRRTVGGWSRVLAGLWLAATGGRVHAQAQQDVAVPASCGSQPEFTRELASVLGAAELTSPPQVSIDGPQRDGRYRLRVELDSGARVLWDRDCRALFRSAVLIVATDALQEPQAATAVTDWVTSPSQTPPGRSVAERSQGLQEAAASASAPPPATRALPLRSARASTAAAESLEDASRSGAAQPPRQPVRARIAAVRERATAAASEAAAGPDDGSSDAEVRPSAWRALVGVGVGGSTGLGPQVAPLIELVVAAERGGFGVALGMHYLFQTATDARLGRGAQIGALGGWVAGSVAALPALRLRAGMAFDRLEGEGKGSVLTRADGAWTLGPRAELALLPLHAAALQLEVGAALQWALLRPSFEIGGFGSVYQAPGLSGAAIVRLSWSFR